MENVHEYKHKSGLKVIFVQKRGFNERYAMFTTRYGSYDSYIKNIRTKGTLDVPLGIAHFLEHKLFEQENGNVMAEYAKMGAKPNAFTSHTQTSYLFSCTDNFDECLRLLLNYVQNPYFTEENVEKEKGIIGQEINMYLDDPDSVVYMNFLKGIYVNNPVRNDIAGTIESISNITPGILYLLYDSFYTPENMILVIVGDEDFAQIKNLVDESIEDNWALRKRTGYASFCPEEPIWICEKNIEKKMQVSTPIFMFGYKDNEFKGEPLYLARKELEMKILHEILFGKSTLFYNKLYNDGLINDSFFSFYEQERSFAYSAFGGEAKEPEKVMDRIQKHILDAKHGNVSESDFQRIKNSSYGSLIKRFNSIEAVCRLYTNNELSGITVFDYFNLYDKINFNSVMNHLKMFDDSKVSVSIVRED